MRTVWSGSEISRGKYFYRLVFQIVFKLLLPRRKSRYFVKCGRGEGEKREKREGERDFWAANDSNSSFLLSLSSNDRCKAQIAYYYIIWIPGNFSTFQPKLDLSVDATFWKIIIVLYKMLNSIKPFPENCPTQV